MERDAVLGYSPQHRIDDSSATPHDRLCLTLRSAVPAVSVALMEMLASACLEQPIQLQAWLTNALGELVRRTLVVGTLDRRLTLIERNDGSWVVADLSGLAHSTRAWPGWVTPHLYLNDPDSWLSDAEIDEDLVHRLSRPRLLLAALYHPEYFPLPRFPLGISDVARAARSTLLGQVSMMDMQLGMTLNEVVEGMTLEKPDILGISATFGQHDLMVRLLNAVQSIETPPLVVAGGSLTARNEQLLLECYPNLLIARGAGETTIEDILAFWHGDLALNHVRGLAYSAERSGSSRQIQRTPRGANASEAHTLPELDLLDETLRRKGVAQLEASRGCTNFCSFCPRSHKGQWAGSVPESLHWILIEMGRIFDRHSTLSRTIYLVDEEFVGRNADAMPRALAVAKTLHQCGFRWETSCRVDQVVRPDRDRAWHLERAAMWRALRAHGLRRCLFGIESGVDTVLERFNKETTADQNALAIRTLSALGIPTRFTYITFDHLMTEAELRGTYAFQGRTDLILKHLPDLSLDAIVDGVHDPEFVATHSVGQPLYTSISYMLVSMECLIGAPYTRKVQHAGLAGPPRPSMGRLDAVFADWRIGRCSEWAQRWVDRHFALDYTLKSLEKILEGRAWCAVHEARLLLKHAAYAVVGEMVDIISRFSREVIQPSILDHCLQELVDAEFGRLHKRLASVAMTMERNLPRDEATLLRRELERCSDASTWKLINASDPCGT